MVSAPPPAGLVEGVTDPTTIAGKDVVGFDSVKALEAEVPFEFVTETAAVPGNAALLAGTKAVSCVALTKVVALTNCVGLTCCRSSTPFQFTTASLVKFEPFTVSVKPCAPQ